METVRIELECSIQAAETLLSILMQSRKISHQGDSKWCCFYADGDGDFKIGDIKFDGEDKAQLLLIKEKLEQPDVWPAKAVFFYEANGEEYEHVEQEVFLSD